MTASHCSLLERLSSPVPDPNHLGLGWIECNPFNSTHYPISFQDSHGDMVFCRYIRYNTNPTPFLIDGTMGKGQRIYTNTL